MRLMSWSRLQPTTQPSPPRIGLRQAGLVGNEGDADILGIELRAGRAGKAGRVEARLQRVPHDAGGGDQLDARTSACATVNWPS